MPGEASTPAGCQCPRPRSADRPCASGIAYRPQIGGAAVARLRVLRQPPEPASPTGWGVPARLRNLHSFRDGIQYARQKRSQGDVKTMHVMHDSVDSTYYGG